MIRNARANDVAVLSVLARTTYTAAFGHSFRKTDLAAHLDKHLAPDNFSRIIEDDVILVAEIENSMIGYVQFGTANTVSERTEDQEIRRLYVHPAFQNQGYGGSLLETALHHPRMKSAARIYLDVWDRNYAAQRFYKRYGFEVVGTRTFEMESGAPTSFDLIMIRLSAPEG